MDQYDDKFVRPLHLAENHFLELLLTRFTMQSGEKGTELQVSFDDNTPAITGKVDQGLEKLKNLFIS